MTNNDWLYKVMIVIGTAYDDVQNPEFFFSKDEKDKMYGFIDTCLENGHEVNIVMEETKQE